jgi:hypothetical protein
MRKLVVMVVLLALALPVFAAPAESPMESFLNLARYFPDDSVGFVAFRTDEGIVDQLDAAIQHIGTFFPDMLPPNFSLRMVYEEPLAGGDRSFNFGEDVRPWLGDAVAVGVTASVDQLMEGVSGVPVAFVAEIKDKDAAVQFATDLLTSNGSMNQYIISQRPDFTIFAPNASSFASGVIAVGDSVMLFAEREEFLPLAALENPLAEGETYLGTVNLLPNEGYDALIYIDTPGINRVTMAQMGQFAGTENPAMQAFLELSNAAYATLSPQVIGLSFMGERSFVMDAAQLQGDTSQLEALGFNTTFTSAPVDLEFAANVPDNATFVMLGSGLGLAAQNGLNNLRALADYLDENGVIRAFFEQEWFMSTEEADRASRFFNLNNLITFGQLSFAGMTGLNLERDIFTWMDGDFAVFVRVAPSELVGLTLDGALVVEASSNPDAAVNVVTKLGEAFDQYNIPYTRENDVVALESPLATFATGRQREDLLRSRELDLLIGVSGDVFSMGTRRAVEYALTPAEGSLSASSAWQAATSLFLPDAQAVAYLNLPSLIPVLAPRMRWSEEQVAAASLLESASLTATMGEAGMTARLAFTLGQAPENLSGGSETGAPGS